MALPRMKIISASTGFPYLGGPWVAPLGGAPTGCTLATCTCTCYLHCYTPYGDTSPGIYPRIHTHSAPPPKVVSTGKAASGSKDNHTESTVWREGGGDGATVDSRR